MSNPFKNRFVPLSGPATDLQPVTPADGADLTEIAVALYVQSGGTIVFDTVSGTTRTVVVGSHAIPPVGTRSVRATGTTPSGIHAMVIA